MGSTLNSNLKSEYSLEWRNDKATGPALPNQTFTIQGQKYTLIKKLGRGGFGAVWSAISPDGKYSVYDLNTIICSYRSSQCC